MNIAVIIPALNEEDSLPLVIRDLPRDLIQEIIVVDNGSTDQTPNLARGLGCRVIDEPQRGYGQACLKGMSSLSERVQIVVFIDGDYSDHAEQLPVVIEPIVRQGYDLVIGSRLLGQREKGAMTPIAYFGNRLACFLIKKFWGVSYTDLGPFRAITLEALRKLNMRDGDFGWTIEMQIKAIWYGLKIKEVPVDYRKRRGHSKISGTLPGILGASKKILWTIFKYKFAFPNN